MWQTMGLSSNQARFLTLTSRQCDLEYRVQQICQRRLRLTSELERIATLYNNQISQRGLFINPFSSPSRTTEPISVENLKANGYYVYDTNTNTKVGYESIYGFLGKITRQVTKVERSAMREGVADGTTLPSNIPAFTIKNAESLEAMNNIVDNSRLSENDLAVVSYSNVNKDGQLETINSIAIRSQEGFDSMINLLKSGDASALKQNYILDIDNGTTIDMSLFYNWTGINNFSGLFDGNFNTIKNLTGSQGLFATASGTLQNIYLDNVNLSGGNALGVGSLVGNLNGGTVTGCKATNINLSFATSTGPVTNGNGLGGLIGRMENGASIDRSSAQGEIHLTKTNATGQEFHSVGGLVGAGSGSSITKSYTEVDMYVPNDFEYGNFCIGTFLAHDGDGLKIENCYALGTVKKENGTYLDAKGGVNNGFGHSRAGVANTSFGNYNGTYKYWNKEAGLAFSEASNTIDLAAFAAQVITLDDGTEIPIWDLSRTPPSLRLDAINIVQSDKYGWTETFKPELITDEFKGDSLEEGIRNGSIILLRDADIYTQEPITLYEKQYEAVDWRTLSCINDELLTQEFAEAETMYETHISQINSQDKKLSMEQAQIEMEYKAITSEKEAVKKILDTNASNSFKYFS